MRDDWLKAETTSMCDRCRPPDRMARMGKPYCDARTRRKNSRPTKKAEAGNVNSADCA